MRPVREFVPGQSSLLARMAGMDGCGALELGGRAWGVCATVPTPRRRRAVPGVAPTIRSIVPCIVSDAMRSRTCGQGPLVTAIAVVQKVCIQANDCSKCVRRREDAGRWARADEGVRGPMGG